MLKDGQTYTAKFLKYVWPFFNIIHERANFVSNFERMILNFKENALLKLWLKIKSHESQK